MEDLLGLAQRSSTFRQGELTVAAPVSAIQSLLVNAVNPGMIDNRCT